jgi:MinD-like ATPase involved in chromosome partitioning or flagellar assembly
MSDTPAGAPQGSRTGRIVTFYSFKGGTGRTMALANTAWILAASGRRVLVADWDLESPGLHRFFHPFLAEGTVRDASGITDLIRDYEHAARKGIGDLTAELIREHARVQPHALPVDWAFQGEGGLDFLSAGRQNLAYATALSGLDWEAFYEKLGGGKFLDAVRADMKQHYDYVLIDSRTGLSDVAAICTVQLPDVLVDCFTLSIQGIEGAAQVAKHISGLYKERGIRILPVPMRVDPAEKDKVEAGHALAVQLFAGFPAGMTSEERQEYWSAVEVPYRAFYAYEETLAVFGDPPGSPTSLLSSFERLAAQITGGEVTRLAPMDEQLRTHTRALFARKPPPEGDQIVVEFGPEDQVWGEWVTDVVRGAGVVAHERWLDDSSARVKTDSAPGRRLAVVSPSYIARYRAQSGRLIQPDLAVYVTGTRSLPEFSSVSSAFLEGAAERDAIKRIRKLLDGTARRTVEDGQAPGLRYPASEPKVDRSPARNPQFTGREDDLRQLREQFRDFGADTRRVVIHGLGGVGKTQVALEYVHRFKSNYDLVWWMPCEQPQFIDASLAELGARMQEAFGISAPTANVEEAAPEVLRLLGQGKAVQRWLLVYDNAEEIEKIKPFLPPGSGHVLITSQDRTWADQAQARSLSLDVFTPAESVAHLRQRAPDITLDEAEKVAEALGNLPLAIAIAGAWLAETGFKVSDYLAQVEGGASRALSIKQPADYPQPVSETWKLSLDRLRERSPAAVRLLELCSVMGPRIALDLLYSAATVEVLKPFDPALSDPMVMGRVVNEINRLALLKLDTTTRRITVHQLVQAVVRERMAPEEIASARLDVQHILAAARPAGDADNPATWDPFRLIWPHLEQSGAVNSGEEDVRRLLIDRVRYLGLRHDLDRGRAEAAQVEDAWESMLAGAPEAEAKVLRMQLLQLRFNLANILREQARFDEARALDEKVLGEQRELLGPDHPHTLMTAGSLAADLNALGRYHEALAMDETTHPQWLELYGANHHRTLAAANNLAVSYRLTGNIAKAQQMDEETLVRRREILGPLHPWTLSSASGLARDLLELGRYAEAVEQTRANLQSAIEALEADSLEALNAQALLGISLRSAGEPGAAELQFLDASSGLDKSYGRSSTDALACRLSHAINQLSLQRPAEAEAAIRDVLAVYDQRLGRSHPHTLACQVNLANALSAQGRHAPALEMARSAAEDLQEILGQSHPYTLAAMMLLGAVLSEQGRLREAQEVEAETLKHTERSLGEEHPDTLRCRANLLLTRQQQTGEAGVSRHLAQTVDELAARIGAEHPDVVTLHGERWLMRTLDPHPF